MMFYKSFVSLVIAFAAASNVAASITPRCGPSGCYAAPSAECNTGSIKCCDQFADAKSDTVKSLPKALLDLTVGVPIAAALGCVNVIGETKCTSTPVCCKGVDQEGLVNVGCSPVNVL